MMQAVHESRVKETPPDIGTLVRDHYDLVFNFCARRLGPDAAADAAQDTFVTAHRALRRYEGRSSVTTWLLGIANNECRRLWRIRTRTGPTVQLEDASATEGQENAIVNRHALQEALNGLTAQHREVILLHEVEGPRYEEIATLLHIPIGTVKSRLFNAFVALRKAIDTQEGWIR